MSTKFIQNSVNSINKNNAGEMLRRMGAHCVKQAYAGNNEDTQYALDNLVQWAREPFASWMRARGVIVEKPAIGSAQYKVSGVKNQKRQNKAIEESKTEPVLITEHKVRQPKVNKTLEGSAEHRANDVMSKLITKLRKTDPDASAYLNEIWALKIDAAIAEFVPQMLKAA